MPIPNQIAVSGPEARSFADGGAPALDQNYEPKGGFDFRHFFHALRERLWIVVLCIVAGLFLALGYLARTPKLYQGHIVLEVEFQEPTFVASEDPSSRMR